MQETKQQKLLNVRIENARLSQPPPQPDFRKLQKEGRERAEGNGFESNEIQVHSNRKHKLKNRLQRKKQARQESFEKLAGLKNLGAPKRASS